MFRAERRKSKLGGEGSENPPQQGRERESKLGFGYFGWRRSVRKLNGIRVSILV